MMKRAIRVGLLLGSVACAILAWSAFALRNGPMAVVVDLFMVGTVAAVGSLTLTGLRRVLGRGRGGVGRLLDRVVPAAGAGALLLLLATRATYRAEEVWFTQGDVQLEGTLYTPGWSDPVAGVVLVHGSGAESRDEYRFYARFLAQHGIAALAYDKRGVGGSSGRLWATDYEGYATDAAAAVDFLAGRVSSPPGALGIVGFSEGEWVGPLAALASDRVAFLAILGASGVSPAQQVSSEMAIRLRQRGFDAAAVEQALLLNEQVYRYQRSGEGADSLRTALESARDQPWFTAASDLPDEVYPVEDYAWWRSVMDFDPAPTWERIRVPVLLLKGGRDDRSTAEVMEERITSALARGGNRDVVVRVLPEGDHLLLEWPMGPGVPPPVFSEDWPELLVAWIRKQVGGR